MRDELTQTKIIKPMINIKNTSFSFCLAAISIMIIGSGCGKKESLDQKSDTSSSNPTKSSSKVYIVKAKVTGVDEPHGTLTIDHERMEGFMEAMEMPFVVEDRSIFKQVRVGSEGRFTIQVTSGNGIITGVEIHTQ